MKKLAQRMQEADAKHPPIPMGKYKGVPLNINDKILKSKIKKLQAEVGHSYDADRAPTLLDKWKLLKAHKIWVTESRRKENENAYLRAMNIYEARLIY
jgi:hypothetical protein